MIFSNVRDVRRGRGLIHPAGVLLRGHPPDSELLLASQASSSGSAFELQRRSPGARRTTTLEMSGHICIATLPLRLRRILGNISGRPLQIRQWLPSRGYRLRTPDENPGTGSEEHAKERKKNLPARSEPDCRGAQSRT